MLSSSGVRVRLFHHYSKPPTSKVISATSTIPSNQMMMLGDFSRIVPIFSQILQESRILHDAKDDVFMPPLSVRTSDGLKAESAPTFW